MTVLCRVSAASACQVEGERHTGDDQDEHGVVEQEPQAEEPAEAEPAREADASHCWSGRGAGLLVVLLGSLELRDDAPDGFHGVGLAMAEGLKVGVQRVAGHLQLGVGETDRVHATNVGASAPRRRTIDP